MSTNESAPPSPTPPSGKTPELGDLRKRERQEGWAVPLDRIDAFTLGAPIAVEPDRIEAELAALWRKAAERAQSEGARFSVTRACLWNFVIHADGEEEFQRSKRLVDELSESVPARIINLFEIEQSDEGIGSGDGSPLRATVEANFRRSGSGRREVLAEEITLEAPRLEGNRLPGLVRSLLLADVPTAMLVRNPVGDVHWLPNLAPEADRFIFDSGCLPDGRALQTVYELLERLFGATAGGEPAARGPRIEIVDLGWLRLWPWRILVGGLFDPAPAAQALQTLDAIEIDHGPGAEPAALLLASWMLSRLPLTVGARAADGSWPLVYQGPQGPRSATLRLTQVAPAGDAGAASLGPVGIARVLLRSGELSLSGRGMADGRCICLASPFAPDRTQPVHGRPDAELMVSAMGVGGRDPLMYEALRLAAELCRKGG